jgi:anti-anti-sigma factor
MNEPFHLEVDTPAPRLAVVRIHGYLDAHNAAELLATCREVAQEKHLVLNLAGVSFIASSGIGALLALVEEFQQTDYFVRLAEISPASDSVIRLLNLDQILSIDPTESAALEAMKAA